VAPGERAIAEGPGNGRERVEPLDDAGEVLELSPREAEPLARVDGGDAIDKFEFEVRLRLERPKLLRR